jgi:Zn-dependent M16 (insulinase) family peptidase
MEESMAILSEKDERLSREYNRRRASIEAVFAERIRELNAEFQQKFNPDVGEKLDEMVKQRMKEKDLDYSAAFNEVQIDPANEKLVQQYEQEIYDGGK